MDRGFSPSLHCQYVCLQSNQLGATLTEMIGEDGVSDRDVSCDTLVEAALGEDAKRGGEMLLPVQSLFLEAVELGVCPDFEFLAVLGLSQRTHLGVVAGLIQKNGGDWSHFGQ